MKCAQNVQGTLCAHMKNHFERIKTKQQQK